MLSFSRFLAETLGPVEFLRKNCSPTTDPHSTSFLLPDGTRLHTSEPHDRAAGYQLMACLMRGVIRYADGLELAVVPTDIQADIIKDDFAHTPRSVLM